MPPAPEVVRRCPTPAPEVIVRCRAHGECYCSGSGTEKESVKPTFLMPLEDEAHLCPQGSRGNVSPCWLTQVLPPEDWRGQQSLTGPVFCNLLGPRLPPRVRRR